MELLMKKKEEEIFKLRQDNQQLFKDIKQLASIEETYKTDVVENKNKRVEM